MWLIPEVLASVRPVQILRVCVCVHELLEKLTDSVSTHASSHSKFVFDYLTNEKRQQTKSRP